VVERDKAVRLLERLRDEARTLGGNGQCHERFRYWHQQVEAVLEAIFGPDADELREFRAIRFDFDPEVFRIDGLGLDTAGAQNRYFIGRLYDAVDLLDSCIVGLRTQDSR